ncbi:MAG: hypothetical protein Q9195_009183 [Heterodermia aff. obscurata]
MKTTSTTEQAALPLFVLKLGSMQIVVLVLLGLIILTSKTAGILALVMLGIILNNSNHFVGSSNVKDAAKATPKGRTEAGPSSQTSKNQQDKSPLFATLPAELRIQLYRHLLVSKLGGRILRPNKLIEENARNLRFTKNAKRQNGQRSLGIDSTFLRCCRRIYEEALPILYGDNIFKFFQEEEVREFRLKEIMPIKGTKKKDPRSPTFNLRPCPGGRLSMIRKLELEFEGRYPFSRTRTEGWEEFLFRGSGESKVEYVRFPRLETLLLDFGPLNLEEDDNLVIRPFVCIFRGGSGLKSLVVSGVENEDNLERFKRALLKEGGEFFPGYPPVQGQINWL